MTKTNYPKLVNVSQNHPPRDTRMFDGHFIGRHKTATPDEGASKLEAMGPDDGQDVVYVNGINTNLAKQRQDMEFIAKRGFRVLGIHNATGGAIRDIGQCLLDKLGKGKNPAVETLKKLLHQSLKSSKALSVIGHSQGALICSQALFEVESELLEQGLKKSQVQEKLSLVSLETAGGAAWTYPDGPKYHHQVNSLDPVPQLFGVGFPAKSPGKDAEVQREAVFQKPYLSSQDDPRDLFLNFADRTVHGMEVYFRESKE